MLESALYFFVPNRRIYMKLIQQTVNEGKQVIVLIPVDRPDLSDSPQVLWMVWG